MPLTIFYKTFRTNMFWHKKGTLAPRGGAQVLHISSQYLPRAQSRVLRYSWMGGRVSTSPNVFISWSGERSRLVAEYLREWICTVVQAAKPWMSESEIEKGSRSLEEITKALAGCKVGITC